MREGHRLIKRIVETLDLGDDDDLFGSEPCTRADAAQDVAPRKAEVSFGDALRSLLGASTAGSHR